MPRYDSLLSFTPESNTCIGLKPCRHLLWDDSKYSVLLFGGSVKNRNIGDTAKDEKTPGFINSYVSIIRL